VSELSGPQKAAVVMMNLDRARAVEVMKHLSEIEAEELAAEIIRMRRPDAATTARALREFHRIAGGQRPPARGGRDVAASLLKASFGAERAAGVLTRVSSHMAGTSLEFLNAADPDQLATLLEPELPQTIALILAHLRTSNAAQVLAALPDPLRTDVAQSIATMGSATQEAIAVVAETMRSRTGVFALRESAEAVGGVQPLVEIINRADAAIEKALLSSIEDRDTTLAEEIRSRMVTFADIVKLEDRDAQRVLRGVDIRTLALALKGVNQAIADVIRKNVSERNREVLDDEIRIMGPVRMSQVEEARAEIVRTIRSLAASGEITVHRADEDEYVY